MSGIFSEVSSSSFSIQLLKKHSCNQLSFLQGQSIQLQHVLTEEIELNVMKILALKSMIFSALYNKRKTK